MAEVRVLWADAASTDWHQLLLWTLQRPVQVILRGVVGGLQSHCARIKVRIRLFKWETIQSDTIKKRICRLLIHSLISKSSWIQRLTALCFQTAPQRTRRYLILAALTALFAHCAQPVARLIIDESLVLIFFISRRSKNLWKSLLIPRYQSEASRTLHPDPRFSGAAGGKKFLVGTQLFKLAQVRDASEAGSCLHPAHCIMNMTPVCSCRQKVWASVAVAYTSLFLVCIVWASGGVCPLSLFFSSLLSLPLSSAIHLGTPVCFF
jgi:hypothetical protein